MANGIADGWGSRAAKEGTSFGQAEGQESCACWPMRWGMLGLSARVRCTLGKGCEAMQGLHKDRPLLDMASRSKLWSHSLTAASMKDTKQTRQSSNEGKPRQCRHSSSY